jgi:hypothetical protein
MEKKKLKKRDPNDPAVLARVLARIDAMTQEELLAMLHHRPEGIEQTNMNEDLAEYDRKKREEAARSKAA